MPPLVFKNIYITGTNDSQREYIENQIKRDNKEEFTFPDFKETYFLLLTNPKIKEIQPHAVYDPESKTFNLFLDIRIQDEINVSFGGNISSLNANQIFLGLSYNSLTELSSSLSLDMQLGNAYTGVTIEGKIEIPKKIPYDITGQFAYNHRSYYEADKLFIETDIATFINQKELYSKLGIGLPFQNKAKTEIFFGYGDLEDRYFIETASTTGKEFDRSRYKLFNAGVYYTKNSFDSRQYAVQGQHHQLYAQFVTGKERYKPAKSDIETSFTQSYIQINASLNNIHVVSNKFNLGYLIEGVFSSKNTWSNFTASILQAPAFTPTPHSMLVFNEAFRANQYFATGISPIYKLNSTIHLRGDAYLFMPVYPFEKGENNSVYYGDLFSKQSYMTELSIVARLPFMNISLFGNFYSYPDNNWNFGLNLGYLIFGPKFIR